jgi:hypothetical protein
MKVAPDVRARRLDGPMIALTYRMLAKSAPTSSRLARTAQKVQATRKSKAAKPSPPLPMPDLLLDATAQADVVTVPARKVLAYEGQGAPESEAFQRAFGALYGIAFTLKFGRKLSGGNEFKVGPLEGRWWAALEGTDFVKAPRDTWRWRLRIAVPNDVTKTEVAATIQAATTRKGGKLENSADAKKVVLEHVPAQRVGRALHVGPYAEEGRTFRAIEDALARAGVNPAFSHIEVYLSDPRRTPATRLKTVLLRETLS